MSFLMLLLVLLLVLLLMLPLVLPLVLLLVLPLIRSKCPVFVDKIVGIPQAKHSIATKFVPPSQRLVKMATSASRKICPI